jgi:transcriptional regulator of arginine metabolism
MHNYLFGPPMISKKARQGRILEVVRKNRISSQEKLSVLLKQEGVEVTQSTLSRDIRELGLVKARGSYQVSGEMSSAPPENAVRRAFEQYVVHSGVSGNIVMIRTSPGNAHSIGVVLDAAQWPEVLGTVAGDDTVFVLLRSSRLGKKVLGKIRELSV